MVRGLCWRLELQSVRSCAHLRTPVHTCAHLSTPAHTCAHLSTPVHTCAHLSTPAHTCSHLRAPAHTCARLFTPAHTCSYLRTPVHVGTRCLQSTARTAAPCVGAGPCLPNGARPVLVDAHRSAGPASLPGGPAGGGSAEASGGPAFDGVAFGLFLECGLPFSRSPP